ncbi:FAS-associated death domain protein isoform X4 [Balaenoptera musculus]|uniref:FAS-associated death domain protein n=1 Tax=Balaenoptera musculus TaxID=9771 RepID=A0A8B8Y6E6_BALMU|nr:FAS-associated death domain protein isoform X4 [Balaenoptera musculus]
MDPFLVLLHSVSAGLSSSELTELKFLCQSRVGKRKLERVQSGLDLFSVLLEQNEMSPENTVLLREMLVSLRRQDLLRRLEDFEAGAAGGAAPEEREITRKERTLFTSPVQWKYTRSVTADLRAAFDIICDNVGKDWRKLARHLRVSDAKIEAIEEKYPRNLAEQVRESLRVWKNSRREDAAASHLVRALRACRLNLVADLIEEGQRARALQSESGDPVSLLSWDSDSPASGASR